MTYLLNPFKIFKCVEHLYEVKEHQCHSNHSDNKESVCVCVRARVFVCLCFPASWLLPTAKR